MKLSWIIEPKDIELVREVIEAHKDKPIVVDRFERNLQSAKPPVKMDEFWFRSVCCLVTSRQPSGEESWVARFVRKTPLRFQRRPFLIEKERSKICAKIS